MYRVRQQRGRQRGERVQTCVLPVPPCSGPQIGHGPFLPSSTASFLEPITHHRTLPNARRLSRSRLYSLSGKRRVTRARTAVPRPAKRAMEAAVTTTTTAPNLAISRAAVKTLEALVREGGGTIVAAQAEKTTRSQYQNAHAEDVGLRRAHPALSIHDSEGGLIHLRRRSLMCTRLGHTSTLRLAKHWRQGWRHSTQTLISTPSSSKFP